MKGISGLCENCVYVETCGTPARKNPCDGRTTKTQQEMSAKKLLADIKKERPGMETMYEDYMIDHYGSFAVELLRKYHLIETCAVINGRKLYAL